MSLARDPIGNIPNSDCTKQYRTTFFDVRLQSPIHEICRLVLVFGRVYNPNFVNQLQCKQQ